MDFLPLPAFSPCCIVDKTRPPAGKGSPMSDIERLKKELEEIKHELASLKEGSRAYKALAEEKAWLEAKLEGSGAIAQGEGAKAVGERAVMNEGGMQDSVVNTGDNVEITIGTQPRAKTSSLRESYLSYVLEQVSPLMLSGVVRQSQSEAETRLNLSAVYTALMTQQNEAEGFELDKDHFLVWQKTKNLSVVASMNKRGRMVLLGDPGSGKSTFVNFVALCMAGEALGRADANLNAFTQPLPQEQDEVRKKREEEPQPQPWEHGTLIPVRIILRDFAARGLPAAGETVSADCVWNFIEAEMNAASLGEFAPLLKKELRDQGGLILFDGLDEVPEAERRREQMRAAIEGFVAAFPRCRYLVTSRTYAYQRQDWKLKGFEEAILAPFTNWQITNFVDRWYAHITLLKSQNMEDGKGKAQILKRAILANERLMSLAERPLLLTLMASIHAWRGGTLPDKRQELYADAVDLLLDWWESQRVVRDAKGNISMIQPSLAEWLKVDRKKVRDLLNRLAFEAHKRQGDLTGTADVPESQLIAGLMELSQNPDVKPARLIEYLRDRAGLLIPRGVGVYTFPHRTFQEYLAACHLTDFDYPELIATLARSEPNRWREVALLAGAKAAGGAAVFALWSLVDSLSPEQESGSDETKDWGAQIAGQAAIEIADLEKVGASTQAKIDRLQTRLLDIMEGNRLPAIERVQAGNNLSTLGDPRFNADLWHLPTDETLGFVRIPAGKFLMGSDDKDEQAQEREKPQHEVDLPEYWMAKYPVTVAQFRAFVETTKYDFDKWGNNQVSTHPVVSVTWYDALEYTKWLDGELRKVAKGKVTAGEKDLLWQGIAEGKLQVTLPSEAEWEKAARGGSPLLVGRVPVRVEGQGGKVRIYPWGDDFDPEKANTSPTKIGDTSSVGCFPAWGHGLYDMSGNVWEWTRSISATIEDSNIKDILYPYKSNDGLEDLSKPREHLRGLRGGSFSYPSDVARCAYRYWFNPDLRHWCYGFRVVVSSRSEA
jgi:formylglycine-generating enzyme required for sulfatase activity